MVDIMDITDMADTVDMVDMAVDYITKDMDTEKATTAMNRLKQQKKIPQATGTAGMVGMVDMVDMVDMEVDYITKDMDTEKATTTMNLRKLKKIPTIIHIVNFLFEILFYLSSLNYIS